MNNKIKMANELLKIAKELIAAGNKGQPFHLSKGKYHNNASNFDAYVSNKYQGEFEGHNKNVIIKQGIPVEDYYDVLANMHNIFLQATEEDSADGRSPGYDVKNFGLDYTVNRTYHVTIKVLMPTAKQLVPCINYNFGYKERSLIRASSLVNCHFT